MSSAATFAAVFAALYAAHSFGDHWVQAHRQALAKGGPGWAGRIACGQHVLNLAVTKLAFIALMAWATGLQLHAGTLAAGLAVDGISHYWADRAARHPNSTRTVTLARLAILLGKGDFYRMGAPRQGRDDQPHLGTGAYALDQSWHHAWLFITALIITL